MARFASSAVAALVLIASLAGSAEAGVRLANVIPNGVKQRSVSTTAAGNQKVTKTIVAPNGATVSKSVVHGPQHDHVKTTFTRPNGVSTTTRTRN